MKKHLSTTLQLVIYFLLFLILSLPFVAFWFQHINSNYPDLVETPIGQFPVELASVVAALLATWLMGKVVKSVQLENYGLRHPNSVWHLIYGTLIGVGLIFFIVVICQLLGVLSFNPNYPPSFGFLGVALIVSVSANAIVQEIIFRGYFFSALEAKYSPKTAIIISSLIFTLIHAGIFSAAWPLSVIGGLNLFLAGVLMSVAYLRTKSLWLPIGLHIGWNLTQAMLNLRVTGHQLNVGEPLVILQGAPILTGGSLGLEGSIVGIAGVILGLIIVAFLFKKPATVKHA